MGTAPCLALSGKLEFFSLKKGGGGERKRKLKKKKKENRGGKGGGVAAKVLFPTRGSSPNTLEAGVLMPWCFLSDEL